MLLLVNTSGDAELERTSIEMLLQRQVDGVLYAAMYHRNVRVPESLGSTPTVLLDARSEDPAVPFVVPDEVQGGYTAVRELIDHGHRRIGVTVQTVDVPARQGRLEGYRKALAEVGVPLIRLWSPRRRQCPSGRRSAMWTRATGLPGAC